MLHPFRGGEGDTCILFWIFFVIECRHSPIHCDSVKYTTIRNMKKQKSTLLPRLLYGSTFPLISPLIISCLQNVVVCLHNILACRRPHGCTYLLKSLYLSSYPRLHSILRQKHRRSKNPPTILCSQSLVFTEIFSFILQPRDIGNPSINEKGGDWNNFL